MTEAIEHILKLLMLFGGTGYLFLIAITIVSMLQAARRVSDDWDEHVGRGKRLEA